MRPLATRRSTTHRFEAFNNVSLVLTYLCAGVRPAGRQGQAARAGGRQAAGADRGAHGEGGRQRGRGAQADPARERGAHLGAGRYWLSATGVLNSRCRLPFHCRSTELALSYRPKRSCF